MPGTYHIDCLCGAKLVSTTTVLTCKKCGRCLELQPEAVVPSAVQMTLAYDSLG